ncbi:MAG: hypothetical protein ACREQ2_03410 [Candidatus Binatia bacterium]
MLPFTIRELVMRANLLFGHPATETASKAQSMFLQTKRYQRGRASESRPSITQHALVGCKVGTGSRKITIAPLAARLIQSAMSDPGASLFAIVDADDDDGVGDQPTVIAPFHCLAGRPVSDSNAFRSLIKNRNHFGFSSIRDVF